MKRDALCLEARCDADKVLDAAGEAVGLGDDEDIILTAEIQCGLQLIALGDR